MRFFIIIIVILFVVSRKQKTGNTGKDEEQKSIIDSLSGTDIKNITRAIRENPQNADNFFRRARLYAQQENYKNAVEDLEIAMKLDSKKPEYYTMQSDYYLIMRRPEQSLYALENSYELFPEDTTTLLKLGEFYYFIRNFLKSHEFLNKLLAIDRFNEKAYFTKGMVYLESNDTTNAIQSFQRATEYNPDFYDSYIMLGTIFSEKHDILAIDYFKNAIELDNKNTDARLNLALFYQTHDMFEEAIIQYQYIIDEIDPGLKSPYYNTGYIYLEFFKEYEKAIPFFQKAYELDPEYADAVYNEGLCYEYLNNFRKARELYKKSLEIVPNYVYGVKGLNRLDEEEKKLNK